MAQCAFASVHWVLILGLACRMASLGMNIVTVLHQPRFTVFSLFHEVLLLGRGGRTVFLGPVSAAMPYFSSLGFELPPNENPADFFLDIISGIVPCKDDQAFRPVVSSELCHLPFLLAASIDDHCKQAGSAGPVCQPAICHQ